MTAEYTFERRMFHVYLKSSCGHDSILTHRNKTAWSYRTAKKHMLDCVANKLNKGMFPDVEYFAVVAA